MIEIPLAQEKIRLVGELRFRCNDLINFELGATEVAWGELMLIGFIPAIVTSLWMVFHISKLLLLDVFNQILPSLLRALCVVRSVIFRHLMNY